MKTSEPRRKKFVTAAATFLTLSGVLSWMAAEPVNGAPDPKVLTPAEFAKRSKEYLRYKQYVQTTVQNQQQQWNAQLQKSYQQQLEKNRAAAIAAGKTLPPSGQKPPRKRTPIRREEILLVMKNPGAKGEDIKEAIENAQGEICGVLGSGNLGVLLVKPKQPGKYIELQRALARDTRDFKHVDFNQKVKGCFIPTTEPTFSNAWFLLRMRICDAWDEVLKYSRFPMPVAVFDSGVQGPEPFTCSQGADTTAQKWKDRADDINLDGFLGTGLWSDSIKDQEEDIIRLGNNIKTLTYGIIDGNGHGTAVASCISGSPYNGRCAAGVNSQVPVYPIKIGDGPYEDIPQADELSIIAAMCVMYDNLNMRIINISYGGLGEARRHEVLHEFFKDWFYRKNGMIFVSAGNDGEVLNYANQPYVYVVSGMAHKNGMQMINHKKSGFISGHGKAVDFTAPGEDIPVSSPMGDQRDVDGTSFSSPIVAGVASMIWTINPNLKNTEVEKIMINNCENTDGSGTWNESFGWGMPDAFKCCVDAEKTVK